MYYHVYVHHYPYMVCSISVVVCMCVLLLLLFMNKEIIMKWVIQMSIRIAIIIACAVVDYIYFW